MSPVQYTNADVTPTLLVQGVESSHGNRAAIPLTLEPEAPALALALALALAPRGVPINSNMLDKQPDLYHREWQGTELNQNL